VREGLAGRFCEGRVLALREESSVYLSLRVRAESTLSASRPGQFFLVGLGGERPFPNDPLLLRPMSVLADSEAGLSFLFKIVGRGTRALAALKPGDVLRLLGPLGRPFSVLADPPPLLVGGGVGIPPLIFLAHHLSAAGIGHRGVFGFNTATEIPRALLSELKTAPEICTLDGSEGFRGNPLELLGREAERPPARVQACGPAGLLKALSAARRAGDAMELSLEERMACGVGVCRGCVVPLSAGEGDWRYGTVCREGPVFEESELHGGALDALRDMAPETAAAEACGLDETAAGRVSPGAAEEGARRGE